MTPKAKNQKDEVQRWWRMRLMGRVYNDLGYLDQNGGHYGRALDDFHRALPNFTDLNIKSETANTLNNLAFALASLGRNDKAWEYVNDGLKIRDEIGRSYPVALSLNTLGIIEALHDDTGPAEKNCLKALGICRKLGHPRGSGLAQIGLAVALRKQGNKWRREQFTDRQASAIFRRAEQHLRQAVQVFSTVVNEPLRLWEAQNELGSLYCDWGWLIWQESKTRQSALDKYDISILHQLDALKIAEEHSLTFQILDSFDDLAQVYADRAFLLDEMERLDDAQASHDKAEFYLKQVEGNVPAEFHLTSRKGFSKVAERGEAYLLCLSKAHLQRGIWIFRKIEQENPRGLKRTKRLKEGVHEFAIATAYIERYWPKNYRFEVSLMAFDKRLRENQVPSKLARTVAKRVESEYHVHLSSIYEAIDDALGV